MDDDKNKLTKVPQAPDFDVALVDIDSIIYSVAWVTPNKRQAEKLLVATVEKIITDMEVSTGYAFVKGSDNFRYNVDPEYKANRKQYMEPEILDRVDDLIKFAQKEFIPADGAEADDYCSIYTYQALEEGKIPVVCHIDKDLNMIPGWHYNFKHKNLYYVAPQDGFVFMCKQLLTGDANDNIPGLFGMGMSTASKMLENRFLSQMGDRVIKTWEQWNNPHYKTRKNQIKDWKTRFLKSANCLILRENFDELRELSEEEIMKKLSWSATNERYMNGITENEDLLRNAITITPFAEMMQIGFIVRYKDEPECDPNPPVIGQSGVSSDGQETQSTTTDSSTESPSSSPENSTSVKSPSGSTRKVSASKKVTGENTPRPAKKSIVSSKSTGRIVSTSKSSRSAKAKAI